MQTIISVTIGAAIMLTGIMIGLNINRQTCEETIRDSEST